MTIEVITREDLQAFRFQLLRDIKQLLDGRSLPILQDELLRARDVKKILNATDSNLQTWRLNGTLKYVKIGGRFRYNREQVEALSATLSPTDNHSFIIQ
jgi:hypothetical protein